MGVRLGKCDIETSRISLGTVKFGRNTGVNYPHHFEIPEDKTITNLLSKAQELGINLLDTAPAYGNSEERIGHLLPGQRQDWILCTKAGEQYSKGRSIYDFSKNAVKESVAHSLRRLKTDYLDIVLIHSNGNDLDILHRTDAMTTLHRLKEKGDIRYIGMSTKSFLGSDAALDFSDILMLTLNLEDQSNYDIIKKAQKQGTGILLKKVLASGHQTPRESLTFALKNDGVHSAVIGTIDPSHLAENVSFLAKM